MYTTNILVYVEYNKIIYNNFIECLFLIFIAGCDVSKMTPGMHISGYVKSVEDHGCIIDVGNNAVHAFIPTANQGLEGFVC